MANYFVDSTTGDDGDNGTTMDLAFATLKYAIELDGLSAGDVIWVRRLHSEAASDLITMPNGGTAAAPKIVAGWPRGTTAITSASWTNGSTTVDLVVPGTMDREKHLGRYITGPDGNRYMITLITDTDTIVIDNEYAGSTVTGANGAATIHADEDYNKAQAIDDSGWTINVAAWTADADDLPLIDFGANAYYLYATGKNHWQVKNIDWQGSTSYGVARWISTNMMIFQGCLFRQTNLNIPLLREMQGTLFIRCIMDGNANANRTIYYPRQIAMVDCAAYNNNAGSIFSACSDGPIYLENVNLDVEIDGVSSVFAANRWFYVYGKNVKHGGTGSFITYSSNLPHRDSVVRIENWQKVLGNHIAYTSQGSVAKLDVVDGSGDPYKRSGGADSVLEILHDNNVANNHFQYNVDGLSWVPYEAIFEHEFEVDDTPKNYRSYVQAEGAVAADELWLEIEYVSDYTDSTAYYMTKVTSTEAISARSGVGDWSQYLEINNITPAVASKVRVKLFCSYYHATNKIYVDPQARIT